MNSKDIEFQIEKLNERINEGKQELQSLQSAIKENRAASLNGEPINPKLNGKAAAVEYAMKVDRELMSQLKVNFENAKKAEINTENQRHFKNAAANIKKRFPKIRELAEVLEKVNIIKNELSDISGLGAALPSDPWGKAKVREYANGQQIINDFKDGRLLTAGEYISGIENLIERKGRELGIEHPNQKTQKAEIEDTVYQHPVINLHDEEPKKNIFQKAAEKTKPLRIKADMNPDNVKQIKRGVRNEAIETDDAVTIEL